MGVVVRDNNRNNNGKGVILSYRTMPLPAAAGTTTTRQYGCGVAGGRLTEEGGGSGGQSRACVNFGHCPGRLRCRNWPLSTSAIVTAID